MRKRRFKRNKARDFVSRSVAFEVPQQPAVSVRRNGRQSKPGRSAEASNGVLLETVAMTPLALHCLAWLVMHVELLEHCYTRCDVNDWEAADYRYRRGLA